MSAPVQIITCGAAGRMGRGIAALTAADPDIEIVGAVETPGHPDLGRDIGEVAGVGPLGVEITDDLGSLADPPAVILDFTSPEASLANATLAAATETAIVIGTSGLTRSERAEITNQAANMPCIIAANMSIGLNVLLSLVGEAVQRLGPDFDAEIMEIHHNRKKDAPSGTATALAEMVAEAAGSNPDESIVLAREGMVGERRRGEIGVVALRGGDNVGEHTVMLVGTGERVELTHRASSRDCLAGGAIRAAKWLHDKPAGLYSMQDVIAG